MNFQFFMIYLFLQLEKLVFGGGNLFIHLVNLVFGGKCVKAHSHQLRLTARIHSFQWELACSAGPIRNVQKRTDKDVI